MVVERHPGGAGLGRLPVQDQPQLKELHDHLSQLSQALLLYFRELAGLAVDDAQRADVVAVVVA